MKRFDIFTEIDNVHGAGPVPTLSCSDALRQRDRPVSLFTAALLFTHGGFDRDPVIEFDARFPAPSSDLRPFCIDVVKDHEFFFRGLGIRPAPGGQKPINWDKRLYCIDKQREAECFEFLSSIAFSEPKRGFFANTFLHTITVPDPTASNEHLSVTVFGVMSNKFAAYMHENQFGAPSVCRVSLPLHPEALIPDKIRNAVNASDYTGEDPLAFRDS
jgi:hypothetical protein